MVVDAMLEADAELRIAERIDDPDLFVTLDDTLLKQIEWHGLLPGLVRPTLCMPDHAICACQPPDMLSRRRALLPCPCAPCCAVTC